LLKGDVVGLRAIERDDLPQLLEWRNRPEYRQYFREYRELNSENQSMWFEKTVLGDRNTIMFAIVELKTQRLLGACGLCYIDWVNRNADFSIYIGADNLYIDDVYAVDAAKMLMNYGFSEVGLHRIWAEIYDFDAPKQKLFSLLAFRLDGRHRQTHWYNNRWNDSLFYSKLSTEHTTGLGEQ